MVSSLDEARDFYEDALALESKRVGETSVTYSTRGASLKIQADFEPETLDEFGLEPPSDTKRGDGGVHVLRLDEGVEEAYERVEEAVRGTEGEVINPPRDVPWGERIFLVSDPDGYVFEIRGPDG
ncbi:MAG: VOC family protein [Halobacteria archaeon]|nr:VOC family protein [Halobacteria archaeon]